MNLHLHRDLCILGFALSALVAQTPLRLELAATGLDRPVLVTAPSGDTQRAFVVEKNGRIKILRNGIVLAQPFLDLATPGTVFDVAEMGMLGVAFHPQYATNRQFFVFYCTQQFPNVTLQRYTTSAANGDVADPASAVTLLTFPLLYGNHNGGTIAFGADGKLYIAVGDGGSLAPTFPIDPLNNAQRGDSLMGKVLRIDVDTTTPPLPYGIPSDNPFVGPGDPRDEIWALGAARSIAPLATSGSPTSVVHARRSTSSPPGPGPGATMAGRACRARCAQVSTSARAARAP